jgi:hypothetical protein
MLVQLSGTNVLLPNFVRVGEIQKQHKVIWQDFDEGMIIEVRSRIIHKRVIMRSRALVYSTGMFQQRCA